MGSACSERQVVFRNASGAPLVLASTDPSVLSLSPDDSGRLSLHIRTKVGGPLPDRFVIEKVDDFALAVYKDRIEFVSGLTQSSAAIDFVDLASKTFSTHISVLWSRYKIAVVCGTKVCLEVDRDGQCLSATPHRTLPSTSTILIDAKLASRLQRLVWTKNSLPVLRVVCDGSGGDITVSWIYYRPDHVEQRSWVVPLLVALSIVCLLVLLVSWMRASSSTINLDAVAEMQSRIAEMQSLPRAKISDDVALALKEHLAAINRRLQMRPNLT